MSKDVPQDSHIGTRCVPNTSTNTQTSAATHVPTTNGGCRLGDTLQGSLCYPAQTNQLQQQPQQQQQPLFPQQQQQYQSPLTQPQYPMQQPPTALFQPFRTSINTTANTIDYNQGLKAGCTDNLNETGFVKSGGISNHTASYTGAYNIGRQQCHTNIRVVPEISGVNYTAQANVTGGSWSK
ncbi:MAG: hypothetical protein DLM72_12520 [Candidatus Nitrosopolaris wilkensis]|nr:MAG: hypothetical protein DLM72_12520 [Candidatus Nitrosopolaris wilkensis]